MGLGGGNRHDAVAGDDAIDLQCNAVVARKETIAKDAEAPRVIVGRAFDLGDGFEVGRLHHPDMVPLLDGDAHRLPPASWPSGSACSMGNSMQRSCQLFAFASGVRSRYAGWYVTTSGIAASP